MFRSFLQIHINNVCVMYNLTLLFLWLVFFYIVQLWFDNCSVK